MYKIVLNKISCCLVSYRIKKVLKNECNSEPLEKEGLLLYPMTDKPNLNALENGVDLSERILDGLILPMLCALSECQNILVRVYN